MLQKLLITKAAYRFADTRNIDGVALVKSVRELDHFFELQIDGDAEAFTSSMLKTVPRFAGIG